MVSSDDGFVSTVSQRIPIIIIYSSESDDDIDVMPQRLKRSQVTIDKNVSSLETEIAALRCKLKEEDCCNNFCAVFFEEKMYWVSQGSRRYLVYLCILSSHIDI